eukprot:TRINITY_DN8637_c0_g1_i1.p1 TRINITY_DN8637_c0_g1~~TRINITY_DN8637_c0_g1_i1.p1  ORF type:complete len:387 (+),score=76.39 TRINITY_DN8637_c0_g1_i1:149-1162(+)
MALLSEEKEKQSESETIISKLKAEKEELLLMQDAESRSMAGGSPPSVPLHGNIYSVHNFANTPLSDLDTSELRSLEEEYSSRISHFTAMRNEVRGYLKLPPSPATKPVEQPSTSPSYSDDWEQLVSWMAARFDEKKVSFQELRSHIDGFVPKRVRAPSLRARGGANRDSTRETVRDKDSQSSATRTLGGTYRGISREDQTAAREKGRERYRLREGDRMSSAGSYRPSDFVEDGLPARYFSSFEPTTPYDRYDRFDRMDPSSRVVLTDDRPSRRSNSAAFSQPRRGYLPSPSPSAHTSLSFRDSSSYADYRPRRDSGRDHIPRDPSRVRRPFDTFRDF